MGIFTVYPFEYISVWMTKISPVALITTIVKACETFKAEITKAKLGLVGLVNISLPPKLFSVLGVASI